MDPLSAAAEPPLTEITVSGSGSASGPADMATVQIGVAVIGPTVAQATAAASSAAQNLIEALRGAGVADDDLETSRYSIHPEHDHSRQRQRLVGYRVGNSLTVRVRDLEALPALLDEATQAGGDATTMHGLSFGRTASEDDTTNARAQAWANATAKAAELARLAGVELGAPLRISESWGDFSPATRARSAPMAVGGGPPIESGQLTQTVTLDATFSAHTAQS